MSEETEEIESEIMKYIYNVVGMSYNTKKSFRTKIKTGREIKGGKRKWKNI